MTGFLVCRRMQSLLRRQTPLQRQPCKGLQRACQRAQASLPLQSQTARLMQLAATSALSHAKPLTAALEQLYHCGCPLHNGQSGRIPLDLTVMKPGLCTRESNMCAREGRACRAWPARTRYDTAASGLSPHCWAVVPVIAKRMLRCYPLVGCYKSLSCHPQTGCIGMKYHQLTCWMHLCTD